MPTLAADPLRGEMRETHLSPTVRFGLLNTKALEENVFAVKLKFFDYKTVHKKKKTILVYPRVISPYRTF